MDAAEEQIWLDEQEEKGLRHLESVNVNVEGELDIEWCVAPLVALWRASSGAGPVWIIGGDLPTDHLINHHADDARTAMNLFCERWREAAECLLQGMKPSSMDIGDRMKKAELQELGDLLKRRAILLQSWTCNDAKWAEGKA